MTNRGAVLTGFLGKPWQANARGPEAYDCWHLACAVSRTILGRELPDVAVPLAPTWAWMISAINDHPERVRWRELPNRAVIQAADCSIVLMARRDRPAHIGIWLAPERGIIHADPRAGSVFDSVLDLHTKGWTRLRFYEPVDSLPQP